ncbi:hypothetical protein BDZ91DRAFT_665177 [Kalaharituber pfeilii]|nr:hypothetical protein BDZ91DRAFT_665177 [Kalaharituber pfeilii]
MDAGGSKPSVQESSAAIFYVHKELLASVSPELLKHVHNEMREGLEGELILRDVDKETVRTFLKWAYVGEYSVPSDSDPITALLAHIKLYVLGDRFNIPALKNQTFAKVKTSLIVKMPGDKATLSSVLVAAQYAIGNLPSLKEPLIEHITQYLALELPDVCVLPEFLDLAIASPEVIVEVCRMSTRDASNKPGISGDIKELRRQCRSCDTLGTAAFHCPKCKNAWYPTAGSFVSHTEHRHLVKDESENWYLAKCSFCAKVMVFLEREHLRCGQCASLNVEKVVFKIPNT